MIFVVAKGIMNCKIGVKFAENCKIYRELIFIGVKKDCLNLQRIIQQSTCWKEQTKRGD